MTRSLRFYLLIVFLSLSATSTSFGQTELPDEVNDLMYDSSKEYQKGDTVWDILDENGTLFTALQTVDPGIAPIGADGKRANQEYWSTGEEYTDAVAKENSDDLDNVPDVVVDETQVPNEDIPDVNGSDVVFARLVNLSSRAYIDGNDPAKRTLIASFIIEGNEKKSMLVRGISHSMGIDDPLPNPSIYVNKTVNGVLDENFISNNDWEDDSALVSSLTNHRPDLLPSSSLESALILKDLDAGAYSVVLSGVSPSGESVTGVALIDAYEWNIEGASSSKAINISSTGYAAPLGLERIPSFIIEGDTDSQVDVVIRALGPGLTDAFGLTGVISDPQFNLVNAVTGDFTEFPLADDWGDQPNSSEITETGYAPPNAKDAAMLVSLPPGAYSVIGQATTNSNIKSGTISVEVFDVSNRN